VKPFPHRYDARLVGGATGYASLSAQGLPYLSTAPPADFDGPGDAWSPEHLLLASVEACFLFTLRAVARAAKIEIGRVDVEISGTVDRLDGTTRFTEIVLRPTVEVGAGTDRDRAQRLLEKTEKACLVSSSLSTAVRLEPTIIELGAAVALMAAS
jgi:peroxiredoxin-like protein